jgi:ABC-type lipoprotein export system ATPase subunit
LKIVLKDVVKEYQGYKALDDVSLEIPEGEFAFIAGRSGSGKTTLLSIVAGLTKPTSGSVLIDGTEIWSLDDHALSSLRNKKIGFMFQGGYVISTLSVIDNVILPTIFDKPKFDVYERSMTMLEKVGLAEKAKAFPSQLSGGQRRRISIARALMNNPEIILADEPTSELDTETEQEIMGMLRNIHSEGGVTMLMVSHNYELADYASRRLRMVSGKLGSLYPTLSSSASNKV